MSLSHARVEQAPPASAPAGAELAPGLRLGPYTIIGLIARGGMAEIYLATEHFDGRKDAPDRPVIIKRVLPELPASQNPMGMFADEAALSSQLEHPNIVQVLDILESGGDLFIVFEHLHGADAHEIGRDCDRRGGRLPLEVALHLVAGICGGLHHAHEPRGPEGEPLHVIHRDVTPQNLFLTFDGEVKLLDFGLAKSVFRAVDTRDGVAKGKLTYMSPEQVLTRPLDRRTDVFSLGIVLYELTVGVKLFNLEKGEMAVVREILDGRVPPPRELDPSYPAALEAVVQKALSRNPEDRYPTAHAFQRALVEAARESGLQLGSDHARALLSALYPDRAPFVDGEPGELRLRPPLPPRPAPPIETPATATVPATSSTRPPAVTERVVPLKDISPLPRTSPWKPRLFVGAALALGALLVLLWSMGARL